MHAQGGKRRQHGVTVGDIVHEADCEENAYEVVDVTRDTITIVNPTTGNEHEYGVATFNATFEVGV